MRAQILSIGDEILGGYITDTNSTFLAQQLGLLNIDVSLVTHVGDTLSRIVEVLHRALDDAEIVICTGGVGPTADDLTREAIAEVMGESPVVDAELLATIKTFFAARGLDMPERNAKQAWLIPSATPLANPVGTAPGWFVQRDDRVIAAMPGVPREMVRMWTEQLRPRLEQMQSDRVVRSTTIKTIGIGESLVEQMLHNLVAWADPVVATYAKDDGVHVRVTAVAETDEEATTTRDDCVAQIKQLLGHHVYGADGDTLAGELLRLLNGAGLSIAIYDAGGGGRFGSMLLADPAGEGVLREARSFPSGTKGAQELAERAVGDSGVGLGVGISIRFEEREAAVYAGQIDVAVRGQRSSERAFTIRSAYEDVQRRSALFAAELLRSALLMSETTATI
jgi:nicotinamide-nucleotide amidase